MPTNTTQKQLLQQSLEQQMKIQVMLMDLAGQLDDYQRSQGEMNTAVLERLDELELYLPHSVIQVDLAEVAEKMEQLFSLEQVEALMFDLGVDRDEVAGDTKPLIVRNFLKEAARMGMVRELLKLCKRKRPFVEWL
jgi:hypothetical protein